jgi:diaminopimelate epimerase
LNITFFKYQGAGNDFIMIDNRDQFFKNDAKTVQHLCDRRFGIGADGLILLENDANPKVDFKMVYFNSDGNESTLCGNGGRCIVAFAKYLGIIDKQCKFTAIDGLHTAHFEANLVSLSMPDVNAIETYHQNSYFLDTGSPHHIDFVKNTQQIDVKNEGSRIRNSKLYGEEGSNINFVEVGDQQLKLRTYERGVEDETLACGTGVTAAAVASHYAEKINITDVPVSAVGGNLRVRFSSQNGSYTNIALIGPAEFVFKGEILC